MDTKDLARLGRIALKKFKGKGVLPSDFALTTTQLEIAPRRELTPKQEKEALELYKKLGISFTEIK